MAQLKPVANRVLLISIAGSTSTRCSRASTGTLHLTCFGAKLCPQLEGCALIHVGISCSTLAVKPCIQAVTCRLQLRQDVRLTTSRRCRAGHESWGSSRAAKAGISIMAFMWWAKHVTTHMHTSMASVASKTCPKATTCGKHRQP